MNFYGSIRSPYGVTGIAIAATVLALVVLAAILFPVIVHVLNAGKSESRPQTLEPADRTATWPGTQE